jgi:Recombinase zinc beta ribbon domain
VSRQNYLRHKDGRLWGRPTNGVESRYLLAGMAICGVCGAVMLIRPRQYGSKRGYFNTCGANWKRGSCANDLEIPMEMADASVLSAVEEELLTPDVVTAAIADLVAPPPSDPDEDLDARRCRLPTADKLGRELERLAAAIAEGHGTSATLAAAIRGCETQRKVVVAELRQLETPSPVKTPAALNVEALRHLDEWRGLLGRNTSQTRQLLRKVLDGRVAFIPHKDASDQWYELAGHATLEKFFAGIPAIKEGLAVRGFEPRSRG